jgi:hypothetical protein
MSGSRYWWYRWTGPDGKHHAVSTKTDDEAEAIVKARAAHVDFEQQIPRSPLVPLIDRYLGEAQTRNKNPMRAETAKNVRYVLIRFLEATGAEYVSDVTTRTLNRWVDELKKTNSQETLCSYTTLVLTFGRWLHKTKRVTYLPLRRVRTPRTPCQGS